MLDPRNVGKRPGDTARVDMGNRIILNPGGHRHNGRSFGEVYSKEPRGLDHKSASTEILKDAELAEAIHIGRETLGEDHPLVKAAVQSLKLKERRRLLNGSKGDELTAAVSRGDCRHVREAEAARVLAGILGEYPIREAPLEGFGLKRVDMLFPEHRLVVEENSHHHIHVAAYKERDRQLRAYCASHGLQLIEIWRDEPLTREHLAERLAAVGIEVQ